MLKVDIADMKARLSTYVDQVVRGETILLCRRNVPVAELRPVRKRRTDKRPVGTDPGLVVPDSFFEPLPEELLRAFEGNGIDGPDAAAAGREPDLSVEVLRQSEARLKACDEQKRHSSREDGEPPRSLRKVTSRLQSPLPGDRTALAMAAERLLLAGQ